MSRPGPRSAEGPPPHSTYYQSSADPGDTVVVVGQEFHIPFRSYPDAGDYRCMDEPDGTGRVALLHMAYERPGLDSADETPAQRALARTQVFYLVASTPGPVCLHFTHHPAPGQAQQPDGRLHLTVVPHGKSRGKKKVGGPELARLAEKFKLTPRT